MSNDSDYSTTVIYKITCNDPNITDKYVGHTIDFVRRRKEHKNNVCNEQSAYYNLKLYKFIRDNGGWDNWKIEVIAFYNCNNLREARQKEQEHYIELKATLNSVEPLKTKIDTIVSSKEVSPNTNDFFCEDCDYRCSDSPNWNRHKRTLKHLGIAKKVNKSLTCDSCDFVCYKHSKLEIHKNTEKHKRRMLEMTQTSSTDSDIMSLVNQLMIKNTELQELIIKQTDDHKKEMLDVMNKTFDSIITLKRLYEI